MQARNPSGLFEPIRYIGSPLEGPLRVPVYAFRPEVNVQQIDFNFPSNAVAMLNENIVNLISAVENLTDRIEGLEQRFEQFVPISYEPRKIDIGEAKIEIKTLFEAMHGQTIFPSEIAEELRLDYDLVVGALTDLENEGQIRPVNHSDC